MENERERLHRLMQRGILRDPKTGRAFFTGYSYKTLYDWDQYFEGIVQLHMGWGTRYICNAVRIFLAYQEEDGFIRRCVNLEDGAYAQEEYREMVKPFLAQLAWLCCREDGHVRWLEGEGFRQLEAYLRWWIVQGDPDENDLSVWRSAMHSGMDNQHERAGKWRADFCEGIDLNVYIYRECLAMARLARQLQLPDKATLYTQLAACRARAVQTLWCEEDGCYYDRDARSGAPIRVKTAAMFFPLWGGLATQAQARLLVERHLTNPQEFWRRYPLPALAADEPSYSPVPLAGDIGCCWRANTWVPVNYLVMHGLQRYGYTALAAEIVAKTGELLRLSGEREYYETDTGEGCGLSPFWGWSLLGYFMEAEQVEHRDPTSLDA